ncbi:MAG: DJ-1/PfpI family protein [Oscillospiraceae bacterium]|nr:DJ-1/PfpI family protein [Candidatus Ruminococcus equi]
MFYCFLAEGFEEIEALATVDILRRAGIGVKTVGVNGEYVTGNHNITVKADMLLEDLVSFDDMKGVILPGGMPGVTNLDKPELVKKAINYCIDNLLLVCAICAAPSMLGRMGVLKNKEVTCYPGFEKELIGAKPTAQKCVVDGNFITAKGPGCAFDFANAIICKAESEGVAKKVFDSMQV